MAEITFIQPDGQTRRVVAEAGLSVMKAAVTNGVDGIEAVCGGVCACATCHCYVAEDWFGRLPPPDDLEEEMLEETSAERRSNSRLSCQIKVADALDGLLVTIPPSK